jgi:hypothetical protein
MATHAVELWTQNIMDVIGIVLLLAYIHSTTGTGKVFTVTNPRYDTDRQTRKAKSDRVHTTPLTPGEIRRS